MKFAYWESRDNDCIILNELKENGIVTAYEVMFYNGTTAIIPLTELSNIESIPLQVLPFNIVKYWFDNRDNDDYIQRFRNNNLTPIESAGYCLYNFSSSPINFFNEAFGNMTNDGSIKYKTYINTRSLIAGQFYMSAKIENKQKQREALLV